MQKYGVTPHCLYRDLLTLKTGVHFRDFSTDRKINFSETRNYFSRVEKSFRRVGIINTKMILLREKVFVCGKCLWKDTQKESFMFWLRN